MKKRISEAEAYRAWHREQRQLAQYKRELRRIRLDIETIELSMAESIAHQRDAEHTRLVGEWLPRLAADRAFNKALARYWGHTPKGWMAACGCDGRMKKLVRDPGWDVLREVIDRIRRDRGYYGKGGQHPRGQEKRGPDATLWLKVQLGYGG